MAFRFHAFLTAVVTAIATWQFAPAAATVPYDIVYVRSPRPGGDAKPSRIPDVFRPSWMEPKSDLVILHPDGSEETLVAAGPSGAVTDPCVSFDGQWVYYSYLPDVVTMTQALQYTTRNGADIFKINVKTRQVVQLTRGEYTPSAFGPSKLPYGIFNMGACPVTGGKVVFTSNRNGFEPPKGYTPFTSQLYVMNEDGSDVEAIAPMTLGAALHPFQLTDGRIAFSTYESQGLRDQRLWGYWTIWPDGRVWEPLWSAFVGPDIVLHWAGQFSGGDVVVTSYYNVNNQGFGAFFRFPLKSPTAPINFGSPNPALNPGLTMTGPGGKGDGRFGFTPVGATSITPWTHPVDDPSPQINGRYQGKVTQPSGAPDGDLLLTYSPGPANERQFISPAYDAGIYLMRGGKSNRPDDLVLVRNDPRYNEQQARPLVPFRAIYGIDEPNTLPVNANDGSRDASLPAGTPYGIIGTSSVYKRESFPGIARPNFNYDGLDVFNPPSDSPTSNWLWQGSDAGKYGNDEIAAIRILVMEPRSHAPGQKWFVPFANERVRVLGEIPLRKFHQDGKPILDPEGNPDTSFAARVPADTPFTFQLIDGDGRNLTMAQTWHQVRPGEVRVDCGGCHSHSQAPLDFARTAASKLPPTDLTLQPAHDVEFVRDIRPILQAKCVTCHNGDGAPAKMRFDLHEAVTPKYPEVGPSLPHDYALLARNQTATIGGYPTIVSLGYRYPNASRYVRPYQSRRSLLAWKVFGGRLDGWTNAQWPTETVPGDVLTLAGGQGAAYIADLDYGDTANHGAMLSEHEKRLLATWIDLGAPIDLGGGYFQDETRPALALTLQGNTLVIGVADAYSRIVPESLSVTINGRGAAIQPIEDGRWRTTSPLTLPARIVARVRDRAGNWTERRVQFQSGQSVKTAAANTKQDQ